ncbi:N-acetylmuramoyl-L-alanine amidase [Cohnella endophytica]|uniref:N-acetylmuramoyl-L-alanine amidase n=2 Tax=Cohnella endophytica TaxID=2419778 RepID=A0A494XUB4_9BACL|nr:N-acetylmuramoyl-L-alanine amidase [Cohnella endophytica]
MILCLLWLVVGEVGASSAVAAGAKSESALDQVTAKKPLICIEAGHQAKANLKLEPIAPGSKTMKAKVAGGTSGVFTKKPEYKLTLEVALKLETVLKGKYRIVMVRRTNDVNLSNSERAIVCNEAKADVMIRLHADGSTDPAVKGMTFFYPSSGNELTKPISKPSMDIAKLVSQQVIKETGAKLRGVNARGDLTGFNYTKVPTFLIEMGFMTNKEEDEKMSKADYQDLIVAGIAEGLDAYFKRPKDDK